MTLFSWLRCEHAQLSDVFTMFGRTYQVCLRCGAELEYDMDAMQPTGRQIRRSPRHPDYVHIAREAKKLGGSASTKQPLTERTTR